MYLCVGVRAFLFTSWVPASPLSLSYPVCWIAVEFLELRQISAKCWILGWIRPGFEILSRSPSEAIPGFDNFIFKKLSISLDRPGVFKDGKVKEINRLLIGQACNSLVNWI